MRYKNVHIRISFRVCVAVSGVHYVKGPPFYTDMRRIICRKKEFVNWEKIFVYFDENMLTIEKKTV